MISPFAYTFISVLAVSGISLAGVVTLYTRAQHLKGFLFFLISFAVGSMLGDVFFHIIPELYETMESARVGWYVLAGIVLFFMLEHILHWRHSCKHELEPCEGEAHVHPVAYMNLLSDGLHNFFDGMMIGVSYLINIPLGIATTIAVLLHEIPQELGDFGILVHAGMSKRKALGFNLLSACAAIVGGAATFAIGAQFKPYAPIALALTAGGFLYIAGSDLLPELHKNISMKKSLLQVCMIICGIVIMYGLTYLE